MLTLCYTGTLYFAFLPLLFWMLPAFYWLFQFNVDWWTCWACCSDVLCDCSSFTVLVDSRTATVEALNVLRSALHVVEVGV